MTIDSNIIEATSPPHDTDTDFSESGDISGDGGVMKEIITHGVQGWQKPENGDDVQMHYRGTLLNGTEFDSSYSRNTPFSFKLGDAKVIKGWDIVGKTMAKGEKAKVTLMPEYAYGKSGSPPKIPENATLIFEMELISWTSKRDVFNDGLVIKSELEAGEGWERPGKLAEVTVAVVASLMEPDGKTAGKELHRGEVIFTLGSGQVPEAWEKVIPDMKKGAAQALLCRASHTTGPGIDYVPKGTEIVQFKLKLLSWRKIEDIHSDGTLVKKVVKEGDGWERPNDGSDVTITAKYFLPSMESNLLVPPPAGDSFHSVTEQLFKVGDGDVMDGVDRVVQSMKENESAIIAVAPIHAYQTAPNLLKSEFVAKGVSKTSRILIEITLLKFEKSKDVWGMSFEEKIEEMKIRKQKGNDLFKAGRYDTAKKSYDRAVAFFDSPTSELSPELKTQVNELLVQCHLNLAMCYEKLGEVQKTMTHCKKALEISPSNVKALYRQGCAFLALDDYYNANSCLKYALQLSPGNLDVRRKLKQLKAKRLEQDESDKRLYSNMFGRMSKLEEKENPAVQSNGHAEATESKADAIKSEEVLDVDMKDTMAEVTA